MTAKEARNSRSKTSVSLTLAAVATQATGTPSPSTATLYFVPRLARSVGLGPVRSPPRLARTEQLSRIRSGWPRSMPTSTLARLRLGLTTVPEAHRVSVFGGRAPRPLTEVQQAFQNRDTGHPLEYGVIDGTAVP